MNEPHFGGCEDCGGFDGYRNVYKSHLFFCEAHRTVWIPGWNLLSSWRHEEDADWIANYERLKGYELPSGRTLEDEHPLAELLPPDQGVLKTRRPARRCKNQNRR